MVETAANPTSQSYGSLQAAYEHFNQHLFAGQLPPCLLTVRSVRGAYGYYCAERFRGLERQDVTDEIALNPNHFAERSVEGTLSTLVHEMVHLWQHHFGRRPRGSYHDRQWAAKMEEVGLIPTDTGFPGGKRTGQRVTHLVEPDGAFQRAVEALLVPAVLYQDRSFPEWLIEWRKRLAEQIPEQSEGEGEAAWPLASPPKPSSKCKFTCPSCGLNAWAKPTAPLACADCNAMMLTMVTRWFGA